MCYETKRPYNLRWATILVALVYILLSVFFMAYLLSFFPIPHDRWLAVHNHFQPDEITDFSSRQARDFTYHFEWTVRAVTVTSALNLFVSHLLVLAAGTRLKMWLLPFLAWNVMVMVECTMVIIDYIVIIAARAPQEGDVSNRWRLITVALLVHEAVSGVVVAAYFRQLHLSPKSGLADLLDARVPMCCSRGSSLFLSTKFATRPFTRTTAPNETYDIESSLFNADYKIPTTSFNSLNSPYQSSGSF